MPCWMSQQNQIDLTNMRGVKLEIFIKAVKAMGFHVYEGVAAAQYDAEFAADDFSTHTSVLVKNGVVSVVLSRSATLTMEQAISRVKQGFSGAVVEEAARRHGWNTTKTGANTFSIQRRY